MKTLYLECSMGAAGDMLMSALLELHPCPDEFIERLNHVGIPDVRVERAEVTKCGIQGTGVRVLINGHEEGEPAHHSHHAHEHSHEHEHDHNHVHEHHHHTGMADVNAIIAQLKVSEEVKADICAVYRLIAEAESNAHGKPIDQIHFHEVGTMDAVADITGVCMLIEEIKPDRIITSPIHVGSGHVHCAHGVLPVPAPATAFILQGVPTYGGTVEGELCTPTGAALLKHFTDKFVKEVAMSVEKIGYGMGKRHFYLSDGTEILSAVRAMLGETEEKTDAIAQLVCNIDDMTGEQVGFAVEQILDNGALDVFTAPVFMKKNRPGILLTVLCREQDKKVMAELIFKHTTTLGIREMNIGRYVLERTEDIRHTRYGDVRVKKAAGYGVKKEKAEYEDLKKIALQYGIPVQDIVQEINETKK